MGEPAVDITGSSYDQGKQADSDNETISIWNQETLERVQDFADTMDEVKTARDALTAKLNAGKAKLIDDGFNKDALEAAIKYCKTEEDKRQNFDLTYLYCRKALGHPIQDDLFTAAMQQQVTVNKPQQKSSEED